MPVGVNTLQRAVARVTIEPLKKVTMEAAATAAATPSRPKLLAVGSWVVYDLANTIFSFNIVSLFFSLWIVNDMGGKDSDYGLANSFSMFVVFLVAPFLGALSDQTPRRMPFLIATTLVCCAATFLLGITGIFIALLIFIVANVFYQSGLIFYDSLLPVVSTKENRGRVGGIWCRRGLHGIVHWRSDGAHRIGEQS